ncbi:MAG: molecular chaperone HtpG [Desulfovibrio sp.]|jgi:molecular chaperone HtpG|nr:molecular chaperone HtpG [Desulfovibrio sp.]
MSDTGEKENTREFRAEVRKVLHILTNSLYTNREIFLRELLSNASDALDKLRFNRNRGQEPVAPELPLEIRITASKLEKALTITDTGIGMTAEELSTNLGTIAKSGSEDFVAAMEGKKDPSSEASPEASSDASPEEGSEEGRPDAANIIGRFGIGFYSVFMVAEKVEVTSAPAFGEEAGKANVWTSDGLGTYTVAPAPDATLKRGTSVKVYLKPDAEEFIEKYRVEGAIKKHSAFLPFPIFFEDAQVNTQPAIWREPKSSLDTERYDAFYKALTYDDKPPLDVIHLAVDAPVQFHALLYIPDKTMDFFGMERDMWGVDLYGDRVLIQHRNKDVIPDYLAFLKGVTDTADLPLNISRETLQENVVLRKMNQVIVKQVLGHLEKMAADRPDVYGKFWDLHGKIFKLGYHDYANKDRVTALFRFNSTAMADEKTTTSLDEYMARAPKGQNTFWYLFSPNREAARMSPYMDMFRRKGIEVLFLYEPLDEFVMEGMGRYKDWECKSVENADEKSLSDFADKEVREDQAAPLSDEERSTFDGMLVRMKEILGDRVKDVSVSRRLTDSPAVLGSQDGTTSSMEKFFRVVNKDDTLPPKVLEVNKDHPLLRSMLRIYMANARDVVFERLTMALFDSSLLQDGYIREPQAVAGRSASLLEDAASWYVQVVKA